MMPLPMTSVLQWVHEPDALPSMEQLVRRLYVVLASTLYDS